MHPRSMLYWYLRKMSIALQRESFHLIGNEEDVLGVRTEKEVNKKGDNG